MSALAIACWLAGWLAGWLVGWLAGECAPRSVAAARTQLDAGSASLRCPDRIAAARSGLRTVVSTRGTARCGFGADKAPCAARRRGRPLLHRAVVPQNLPGGRSRRALNAGMLAAWAGARLHLRLAAGGARGGGGGGRRQCALRNPMSRLSQLCLSAAARCGRIRRRSGGRAARAGAGLFAEQCPDRRL